MRAVFRSVSAKIAAVVLALVATLAAFGPILAPHDPLAQNTALLLQGPSFVHLLGTDALGRDVLSRLLAGSPVSLSAALLAVVVGLVLGVIPGLLSVYLGRAFEWVSLRLMDTLIALPFLVFAIAMTALLGNGVIQAMVAVGVLISPAFYRVSRAAALTASRSMYVEAAALLGASRPGCCAATSGVMCSCCRRDRRRHERRLARDRLVADVPRHRRGSTDPDVGRAARHRLQYLYQRPWGLSPRRS